MTDIDSKLAYFRTKLGSQPAVTHDLIRSEVENSPFSLSTDEAERIIRELEASFDVRQSRGATVRSEHHPWLARRRGDINFFYWNRLKRYYLEGGKLPPHVVNTLDNVTDEVLDYSGNPNEAGEWKRRGMVVGHVQSGKTTNYAALICKAADAGYKIIILLAGITNSLRRQTQERLDETFIGRKSVFQAAATQNLSILNYGYEHRFPAYGTSREADFSSIAARTHGVSLSALKEPIIFVTKKNKTTLERLQKWLQEQNPGGKINDPLLLIDDEADNASINTSNKPDTVTAINEKIRGILELFNRSSYVGYTATPFANIFIDPESEDEMIGDDLFPRHFIKALDPPTNYVGAKRVFDEQGDLKERMLREVMDYEDVLPLKHKKGTPVTDVPPSLYEAVRVFILTRALRVLRGQGREHCSMMINVSRFNDVQEQVEGLVYRYLEQLRNAITVNAGRGARAMDDPHIASLQSNLEKEFGEKANWKDVLEVLPETVGSVRVTTVNMRGGELDYWRHQEDGLHVIAIGGLALSRGLTLEGLTVSYILRNASASDTLMQMARWFGYRPYYEDLCRLYLPPRSTEHYEFITGAIEELRTEIKRMESLNMTPRDFGLRVRHSPAAIQITAANKMRAADTVTVAQDYQGRHIEGYSLPNDEKVVSENRTLVKGFLRQLEYPPHTQRDNLLLWHRVPGSEVLKLAKKFQFAADHPDLGKIEGDTTLFADYLEDRVTGELCEWDVAVPFLKGNGQSRTSAEILGRSVELRQRDSGVVQEGKYKVTKKNRLANKGDEKLGISDKEAERLEEEAREKEMRPDTYINLRRDRPLLLVHFFTAKIDRFYSDDILRGENPLVSLSFCMPSTRIEARQRQYKVNRVYKENMESRFTPETDDDEAALEDQGID